MRSTVLHTRLTVADRLPAGRGAALAAAASPPAVTTPSRRRVSRRAVLAGLAGVVGSNLGLAAALETTHPHWRDPEYGHRLAAVRRWQATGRPLVLALGSSRPQMGVSPADMGGDGGPGSPVVYNFALAAAGPVQTLVAFRRLLADGVRPAAVLVEAFPAALAQDAPAERLLRPWAARLTAGDLARLNDLCDDTGELTRAWAAARAEPWWSSRQTLASHWLRGWLPWRQQQNYIWDRIDPHGWLPYPADAVSDAERAAGLARVRADHAAALAAGGVAATPERAVRLLLEGCSANGIPAAVFTTPESPAFRSWSPAGARERVAAFLNGLGVPVFAADDDAFAEGDFADGHHLLPPAARRFSRGLGADLAGWLARRPA